MQDLISRQAAIDALTNYIHNIDKAIGMGRLSPDDCRLAATSVLEDLPSAQPEIIRCKDCIFHGLCRASNTWAVAPKDDWYCADAKRRTDE